MSLINVQDLSFHYEGSPDLIFQNISFQIDTSWKLGFIARNGRGKTTFLRILHEGLPHTGQIDASVRFDYFPYAVPDTGENTRYVIRNAIAPFDAWEAEMEHCLQRGGDEALDRYGTLQEMMLQLGGYTIDALIDREAAKLEIAPDTLERPFATLSEGERTKLLIAAMFLRKDNFLLIDEPTNHLDAHGREVLQGYMAAKKGFILVSHDRALLDGVADHILTINRTHIQVQRGNYSSWQRNKAMQDENELARNEQLKGEIGRLGLASQRAERWSDKVEATKIGTHAADRGAIGAQSARMMKKAKGIENRLQKSMEEKRSLLKDIETAEALKLHPLPYPKKRLAEVLDLQIDYGRGPLFAPVSFTLEQGDRLAILGRNGAGKSSILGLLLGKAIAHTGSVLLGREMIVSHVSQSTGHLSGSLKAYAAAQGVDMTLFLTILRKLDFERKEFERPMEDYSAGQKKKVLLAASLATPAHLYIWDEPLNFVDILSRTQIETLLAAYPCTMVFVEHDRSFVSAIATRELALARP